MPQEWCQQPITGAGLGLARGGSYEHYVRALLQSQDQHD
jgi:hypothetical protein